jgi:hypothetical protein
MIFVKNMNTTIVPSITNCKFLLLSFLLLMLQGCVDLSGSRSNYVKKQNTIPTIEKKHSPYNGEVHTMLGGLGLFSRGMVTIKDSVATRYDIPAYNTIWYNAGHVSHFIIDEYYQQKDHKPVILVGHSLGANEQIKVARNLNAAGVPVALLVTVDAVSQTIVPSNVKEVLNVYKSGYVPMFSGLKLRAVDSTKTHIDNFNVALLKGNKVNHFTIDKDPVVQELILARIKKVVVNGKKKDS